MNNEYPTFTTTKLPKHVKLIQDFISFALICKTYINISMSKFKFIKKSAGLVHKEKL